MGLNDMLLVAISCTFNDCRANFARLKESIRNFGLCFDSEVYFYIVYQSKNIDGEVESVLRDLLGGVQGSIKNVEYLSVSGARNQAISFSRSHDFTHLIFHDSSLIYSYDYLVWLKHNLSADLLSTEFSFIDGFDFPSKLDGVLEKGVVFNDFVDLYVWSYCFNLKNKLPFFDERFGPGESSLFAAGEDFLFLREYFKRYPQHRRFLRYQGIGIIHPSRPLDYSKHLAYAEGQGKIHQIYLSEEKNLTAVFRCILFFGNSIFRVFMLRNNSLKIFALRVKGFLDRSV